MEQLLRAFQNKVFPLLQEHFFDDWRRHRLDRSMRHYEPVMQWVGLFLFNRGLTTFVGRHVNLSLLFPMEEVFEDFFTRNFRRSLYHA